MKSMKIAVLITVYNRKAKTICCLRSLEESHKEASSEIDYKVYLTDDGCTDGTAEAIAETNFSFPISIIKGTGSLYWNGGMISSWQAAIDDNKEYDGFLWLNDDTTVLPAFWTDLSNADEASMKTYGKHGIYVGSTRDIETGKFTYGGFNFVNRITLSDRFVEPDGKSYQPCQCAHGNITFISSEVVSKMGIFYDGYIHGAGDHDYTYRAHRAGFPILVMPHYAGMCSNDHEADGYADFFKMPLKKRLAYLKSPFGFNLHNTLLFQKRCFPYRYPFVWFMGYAKALFPKSYFKIYRWIRK